MKAPLISKFLFLEMPQECLLFFFFSTIKRGFSSRNHKNFLSNSLRPTSILFHSSWHGEGMKVGDGKITACFLFAAFADSEIWEEQQEAADSITWPIMLESNCMACTEHFQGRLSLLLFMLHHRTAGKTVNSLILLSVCKVSCSTKEHYTESQTFLF